MKLESCLDSESFWKCILLLVLSFILISSLSPFFLEHSSSLVQFNRKWLATICHTYPDRGLHFNQITSILCSRCSGIYSALFIGIGFSFFSSFTTNRNDLMKLFIIFALVINGIDVIGDLFQFWDNSVISRFVLGCLFGVSISMVFITKKGKNHV